MLTLLIILAGFMSYSAVAGLLQPRFEALAGARCTNCSKGKPYRLTYRDSEDTLPGEKHEAEAFAQAVFWPFTAPYLIALSRNDKVRRGRENIDRFWENKREVDRAEEMAELDRKIQALR